MTVKIPYWNRIETERRTRDLTAATKARLHDPLWLLCRQWQLDEFAGEDAASPVSVQLEHETSKMSRYHAGPISEGQHDGVPYDVAQTPLEARVERPAQDPANRDLRFGVEAGQVYLRRLDSALESVSTTAAADYRQAYVDPAGPNLGVQMPDAGEVRSSADRRFLRSAVGYALDGRALYRRLEAVDITNPASSIPSDLLVDGAHEATVTDVARAWFLWYGEQLSSDPATARQAWQPERLEHQFAVAAADGSSSDTVFVSQYDGGGIDWHSFDERADVSLGASMDGPAVVGSTTSMLPTPATFPGMPNPRWWEFEDRKVSFPDFDVSNLDLARLFVLDFALVYGNDWFTVPLELPVGAVSRIQELEVFDTFNFDPADASASGHIVPAADAIDSTWQMYRVSTAVESSLEASGDAFVLAPSLVRSLESEPIEHVALLRDEIANLAWGVERKVQGAAGYAVDREERWRATLEAPTPPSGEADNTLAYELSSEVPAHWYPLIPRPLENEYGHPENYLFRGVMLQKPGQTQAPPIGEFLGRMGSGGGTATGVPLPEEEVPRAGVQLSRTYQMARWSNGRVFFWHGRQRGVGRGEGASHLTYDDLE